MKKALYWVALLSFLLLMLVAPFVAFSMDYGNPLAAKLEAERRGSHVEMVGGNQASEQQAFLSAVSVPVDDSDKWSISIVSTKSCPPCERLKRDFATSKYLQAWVDVSNPLESATHFSVFYVEDQMQNWRFANIKFRSYPTIVINPPRNGRCGPPGDYLLIEGYNGDHKTLSAMIRAEIKRYCYGHNVDAASQGFVKSGRSWIPPKNPPSAIKSSLDAEGEDGGFFQRANTAAADPLGLMLIFLSLIPGGLTTVVAIVLAIWLIVRNRREKAGKKVLLSDEQFSALVSEIKKDAALIQGNMGNIGNGITIGPSSTPSAASPPAASAS